MRHAYVDTTLMRPSTAWAMKAALRHLGDSVMMGSILYEGPGLCRRHVKVTGLNRSIWDRSTLIRYTVIHDAVNYVGSGLTEDEIDWFCQEEAFNSLLDLLTTYQRQQVTAWPPDRDSSIAPVRLARQWAYRTALSRIGNVAVLAAIGARLSALLRTEPIIVDNDQ